MKTLVITLATACCVSAQQDTSSVPVTETAATAPEVPLAAHTTEVSPELAPYLQLADQMADAMDRLTLECQRIKNREMAENAATKIEAIVAELIAQGKARKDLGDPSPDLHKELVEHLRQSRLRKSAQHFFVTMVGLASNNFFGSPRLKAALSLLNEADL